MHIFTMWNMLYIQVHYEMMTPIKLTNVSITSHSYLCVMLRISKIYSLGKLQDVILYQP
jgi:hypothetical protein